MPPTKLSYRRNRIQSASHLSRNIWVVRKTTLYFLVSITLLLASNTVGFDGYFHSISITSLDSIDYYNPPWILNNICFPRYIAFHYLLWGVTLFGLAPLYPALIIIYLKLYLNVFYSIRAPITNAYEQALRGISLILLLFNTVYFSALGFAISFFIASFFVGSKRSGLYLIIGSLMHPAAFIFGLVLMFLQRQWRLLLRLVFFFGIIVLTFNTLLIEPFHPRREIYVSLVNPIESLTENQVFDMLIKKIRSEGLYLLAFFLAYTIIAAKKVSHLTTTVIKPWWLLILAVIVAYLSVESQLITGGPLAIVISSFSTDGTSLSSHKISMILGAWVSPLFYSEETLANQYLYRE